MPARTGTRTILKYTLYDQQSTFTMPKDAKIVTVGYTHGGPAIWAEVDTAAEPVERTFAAVQTGYDLPENGTYVGSCNIPGTVDHIYEIG